MTKAASNPIPL